MTEPAPFDERRTPFLTWRRKKWPIPPLVADQIDVIWDDVIALTRALFHEESQHCPLCGHGTTPEIPEQPGVPSDEAAETLKALRRGAAIMARRYELTKAQYASLREVVHYGLTRAHPQLTREEFRRVPTTPLEMLQAFFVVRRQSGMYGEAEDGGDDALGEAEAAQGASPISSASSPESRAGSAAPPSTTGALSPSAA
jgi:hypothetical protein